MSEEMRSTQVDVKYSLNINDRDQKMCQQYFYPVEYITKTKPKINTKTNPNPIYYNGLYSVSHLLTLKNTITQVSFMTYNILQ